ncbi:MAG: hypothetical protein D6704_11140 [Nitrospirae bacterium]|nr:MAG: hypothetical protein D6704_11140 [Nitrospirota bacterium]
MITINLFPHSDPYLRRYHRMAWWHVVALVSVILASLTVGWNGWVMMHHERDELVRRKTQLHGHLAALTKRVERLATQQARAHHLAQTVRWIDQVMTRRTASLEVLEAISRSIEPLGLWLDSLRIQENIVTLQGTALRRDDIWRFLHRLEGDNLVHAARLLEVRRDAYGNELFHFGITLVLDERLNSRTVS